MTARPMAPETERSIGISYHHLCVPRGEPMHVRIVFDERSEFGTIQLQLSWRGPGGYGTWKHYTIPVAKKPSTGWASASDVLRQLADILERPASHYETIEAACDRVALNGGET